MNTIRKPSFFILIVLLLCFYQLQTLHLCGVQTKVPFSDEETRNGKRSVNNIKSLEQKRIFLCARQDGNGFREIKKVLSSVYDDYSIEFLRDKEIPPYFYFSNYTHPTNIFVDTYEFPSCKPQWLKWLLLHFEGHYIFFSPESPKELPYNEDSSLQDRFHAIGPVLSKKKNEPLVTYLQAVWWDKLQTELSIEKLTTRRNVTRADVEKRRFLIYANSNCVKFREEAIGRLSFVGVIDCNGKCQGKMGTPKLENINNTKGTARRIGVGNWWLNAALYREYKFCFVMEHEIDHPLYITEKILLAFSANCIPIYHGPTLIFEFFNKNAFIFYNISNPQPSIDLIDSLNKNETALQLMMEEPILAKGDETIEDFFSFNESIGKGKLRQKFRRMIDGLD